MYKIKLLIFLLNDLGFDRWNKFETSGQMPKQRNDFTAVKYKNQFIILGGIFEGFFYNDVVSLQFSNFLERPNFKE